MSDEVKIVLIPSGDEKVSDAEFQQHARELSIFLVEHDAEVSAPRVNRDSVEGDGYFIGEFIASTKIIGPALGTIFGAYLYKKYGRKVGLKIGASGEIEAQASSAEEIAKLMKMAEDYKKNKSE